MTELSFGEEKGPTELQADGERRLALRTFAAARPLAISTPATFPLASLDDAVRTLLTHSTKPDALEQLTVDLLALQQPPGIVAFLSPLFHASSLLLITPPSTSPDEPTCCRVERLWRLLRNLCRSEDSQTALLDAEPAVAAFIAALCRVGSADATEQQQPHLPTARAALLTTGGQLLVNSLQRHPRNQRHFLSTHLLSPPFSRLIASSHRPFRATLLHTIHSLMLDDAQHEEILAHPQSAHLLLAILNPTHSSAPPLHDSSEEEDEEVEEEDDADMFATSILRRCFVRRATFMRSLVPVLDVTASSSPVLVRMLHSLPETTADGSVSATADAVTPLTANCAFLLPLLALHYQLGEPTAALTDDSSGYLMLPSTLRVSPLAHAVVQAVDHALYTTLTRPSSPAPLLATLSSLSHAYLLLALLRSPPVCFDFHSDLLRLLSLSSSYPGHVPPYPVLLALSFLNHTHIEDSQPMQREYAVVGLRALCQLERVQAELSSLQALDVQGKEEWKQRGVDLQLDAQASRVHVQASKPQGKAEKRTSGPIDWGVTRPYTDDDFM